MWGVVGEGVTGRSFKYFTTLKKIGSHYVEDFLIGLCFLVLKCQELKEISFHSISNDFVKHVIYCLGKLSYVRSALWRECIPLKFYSRQCDVRFVPYVSEIDSSLKIFYKVYESDFGKCEPHFTTNDEASFIHQVGLAMDRYQKRWGKF